MHSYALLAAALAAPALAQELNATYIAGLLGALNSLNLTGLVSTATAIANNTNGGTALLAQLSQGQKTVFAPNNQAFGRVPDNVTGDIGLLTSILSYHVLDGHYNAADFAKAPSHTIARTFLTNSSLVKLESNRGQVVVAEAAGDSVTILEPTANATVQRSAMYENLIVHVIDAVLTPPSSIGATAAAAGLSSLAGALGTTNLLAPLEAIRGITVFAPTNAAFTTALAALGSQANNASLISAVLANHVINGTSVYSTGLTAHTFASAGGQPFTFSSNSSGTYVMSGSASAKIVRADIPVSNGVVHLIDAVLANTASDPAAAASAAVSQSSVAATATTIPGQAGSPASSSAAASASGNASLGAMGSLPGTAAIISVLAAGMGALLGGMLVL